MADLFLHNATILTLDERRPEVSALVARGGRIVAIGDQEQVAPHAAGLQAIDLQGMTVVPGFIDSHVHLTWTGIRPFTLDLSTAQDAADVLARVAARLARAPDALLLAQGLAPECCPSRSDLDRLAPHTPIML